MKYSVKNEQVVFNDHYKMLKASVTYDTFRGTEISTNRLAFYRGDSVAILLYELESKSVILTKQFRYPTTKHQQGWMLEIPAGSMEKDECPLTCVKRETLEEIGYTLHQPQQISSFYTSPGASTEKAYLFYAEVSLKDKTASGGGNTSENEDIKIVKLPVSEIENWLQNKIIDAKTILALQWFLLQKTKS